MHDTTIEQVGYNITYSYDSDTDAKTDKFNLSCGAVDRI